MDFFLRCENKYTDLLFSSQDIVASTLHKRYYYNEVVASTLHKRYYTLTMKKKGKGRGRLVKAGLYH